MREDFLEWINSDNVVLTKYGYVTQCSLYVPKFSLFGLYRFFIREYVDL